MSIVQKYLTNHAQIRMQQRGISAASLEALLEFGRARPAGGRRDIVFFDKKARARLARAALVSGPAADRACKGYAIVESDGTVITVGHRFRRLPHG